MVLLVTVGGSVTLKVGDGGGGGSLQTNVEEGLGSGHLAQRTLEPTVQDSRSFGRGTVTATSGNSCRSLLMVAPARPTT